ncbi:MAG: hypothetical protein AB7U73_02590 [Pirellulales bacterium]
MARALLIGSASEPEFAAALSALEEAFEVVRYRDIASALAAQPATADEATQRDYEVIVLAQSRPGEIAAGQLDRLRRRFPLAGLISLLGSWCEGETRSGKPHSTAVRVYWHQAADHLRHDLQRRQRGQAASWSWPATSSVDERLLCRTETPIRPKRTVEGESAEGTIAVFGHERATIELLVDACRASGYDPIWMGPRRASQPREVAAAIWDLSCWGESADRELEQIARVVPAERVVALLSFPRWQDLRSAAQRGIGEVVSKPFALDALTSALGRAARSVAAAGAR